MEHNDSSPSTLQSALSKGITSPAHEDRSAIVRGRVLVTTGLILLALFAALAVLVTLLPPSIVDVPITRALQGVDYGPFSWLMLAVSAPGFEPWNFIFPLVLILAVVLTRHFVAAAFLLLASIASGLGSLVKVLVHRARPTADIVNVVHNLNSYSFPSGHVTEYTLVFGFTCYLAFTLMKPGPLRTLVLVLCTTMILLVAPSRIWMGQHWASDTLGGYALGFGALMLIIWGYRRWQERAADKS